MATAADDSSPPPQQSISPPLPEARGRDYYSADQLKSVGEETLAPWVDYAVQQAQLAKRTFDSTLEKAVASTRSRLDRIRVTSSAHFNQTLDSLRDAKAEFHVYEDAVFGKVKEGIYIAADYPFITTGSALSLALIGLKRPRRFMYYKMMRAFVSEETMLSRADEKVKTLKQSIDRLTLESEKLEKAASQAEDEMTHGRTKLRQAGKQIQSVISSAYKIERKAAGLKDDLRELPRVEASRFRNHVSKLASEAKKERNILTKEITKISNYGISV